MSEQDLVESATGAVVAGVDDSADGRAAVARGLEEAVLRGRRLLAVCAYSSPDAWAPEIAALLEPERLAGQVRSVARRVVEEVVEERRAAGLDLPEVRVGIRTGSPADVLCRIARDADLLVVGHRGRGGLASRLIGSVGLGVVVHATCPVLVVRTEVHAAA